MIIKFKDGQEIEFKQFGKIWLAESVIWEYMLLYSSDGLRQVKAKVAQWFAENAPKELSDRFEARLPLWREIKHLPFKDQIAYREGKTEAIAEYCLGDEIGHENGSPAVFRYVGYSLSFYGWCYCGQDYIWNYHHAVRLCFEEKK